MDVDSREAGTPVPQSQCADPARPCTLNRCLECDERESGPVFKSWAGRTRRNSGLTSAINRPADSLARLSQDFLGLVGAEKNESLSSSPATISFSSSSEEENDDPQDSEKEKKTTGQKGKEGEEKDGGNNGGEL